MHVPRSSSAVVRTALSSIVATLVATATGCGVKTVQLMPTPVVYSNAGFEPFSHVESGDERTEIEVFYATDRSRAAGEVVRYGNGRSDDVRVGTATVRFGEEGLTWPQLVQASLALPRPGSIAVRLENVEERTTITDLHYGPLPQELSPEQQEFADLINERLAQLPDPDIVIYVHGAKVDFYDSCANAANIAHFGGRDFLPLAYSWGTHQNIFSYLDGDDLAESWHAGDRLSSLLIFLADHTNVGQIDLIGYSAGARVLREALVTLRSRFAEASGEELRARTRIGIALFAAPDVPTSIFARDIAAIHASAERVIVTMTDDDIALRLAQKMMRHEPRVGQRTDGVLDTVEDATDGLGRIELIDVSLGADTRGFDITGHHYWHEHPWVISDVILAIRTRLPAEERGLRPGVEPRVWYFGPDYPEVVREAAKRAHERGDW